MMSLSVSLCLPGDVSGVLSSARVSVHMQSAALKMFTTENNNSKFSHTGPEPQSPD